MEDFSTLETVCKIRAHRFSTRINDFITKNYFDSIDYLTVDKEGNVFFANFYSNICVLDSNGEFLFSIDPKFSLIALSITNKRNVVSVEYYTSGERCIKEIDIDKKDMVMFILNFRMKMETVILTKEQTLLLLYQMVKVYILIISARKNKYFFFYGKIILLRNNLFKQSLC